MGELALIWKGSFGKPLDFNVRTIYNCCAHNKRRCKIGPFTGTAADRESQDRTPIYSGDTRRKGGNSALCMKHRMFAFGIA